MGRMSFTIDRRYLPIGRVRPVVHHTFNRIGDTNSVRKKIQYFVSNAGIGHILARYRPNTRADPGAAATDTDTGRRNRHTLHPGTLTVPDNRKRHTPPPSFMGMR